MVAVSPEWARRSMRTLRASLADMGVRACSTCGFSTEALHGAPQRGSVRFGFGQQWLHPLDWMDVERQPALVWQGTPEEGRHRVYMAASCRRCFATTLYERGWYTNDHPDLTTLTDEEQVERDDE